MGVSRHPLPGYPIPCGIWGGDAQNLRNSFKFKVGQEEYVDFLSKKRFALNWNSKSILEYLNDPIVFVATMVATGDAEGMVAGSMNDTSHVIRTSIRVVGIDKDSQWVSSIFFLVSPDGERSFTCSDCGVIPEPTSEQLTEIAKDAAFFHQTLSGEEPRVAFLSFSTKGSASHLSLIHI